MNRLEWIDPLRLAARRLRRQPGYFVPAALTLCGCVAVTLVVFAVVNATLLRPLPYPQARQLLWLWPDGTFPLTGWQFAELRHAVSNVAEASAVARRDYVIIGGPAPVQVEGAAVSSNHFDVFGIAPRMGRAFGPRDADAGASPVALISSALWQGAFGGDPAVVGRQVRVDVAAAIPMVPGAFTGSERTIVGVLPEGYAPFGFAPDLVTPLPIDPSSPAFRSLGELTVVARLRGDASAAAAGARIDRLLGSLPDLAGGQTVPPVAAVSVRDALVGSRASVLRLALGAVLLVLGVACANVAHLSLAQLSSRRYELGVQVALGAGRSRILGQLLAESFFICGTASLGALVATSVALPAVGPMLPEAFSTSRLAIDARVLGFLALVLGLMTVATSALPALGNVASLASALNAHRAAGPLDRRSAGLHQALVGAQVGLGVVLVTAAALLLGGLHRLVLVDPGFRPQRVATVRFQPSAPEYRDATFRRITVGDILARVRAIDGVESAGAVHVLPVAESGPSVRVVPDPARSTELHAVAYRVVTAGYFETMSIPLRRGRLIAPTDDGASPPVVIVNERMAASFWPGADPIGQRLYRANGSSWEVIGVVGDVRQQSLSLPPASEMYLAMAQSEWANAMTIVARSVHDDARLGREIATAIHAVDSRLPVTRVATMTDLLGQSLREQRFYSRLFTVFGALALWLGAVGAYGVAAFLAERRRREIGIRLALGATRRRVVLGELLRTGASIAIGLVGGAAGGVVVGKVFRGLLFDMGPFEPAVLVGAVVTFGAVAFAAVAVSVGRTARVDPLTAIRDSAG